MLPTPMPALKQRSSINSNQANIPVTPLDFNQAMRDFKIMFPDLEDVVIEMVLRSNNGAVDVTINQLLAMSEDNEKFGHKRQETRPKESGMDTNLTREEVKMIINTLPDLDVKQV